MDYKIWISYHKPELAERYGLRNDEHHFCFPTYIAPTEQNINHLNPILSEMVTMWYVWKNNLRSEYVGFNHYRRRFNVCRMPKDNECQIWKIRDFGREAIYQQYVRVHGHSDIDLLLSILDYKYGRGNDYATHIRVSHRMVMACCFLMSWDNFVKLCEFLFPTLAEVALQSGCKYDIQAWRERAKAKFGKDKADYQMRVLSFLAERLISAWITTHLTPYQQKDVAIIHYNTPEITEALVKSIRKHTSNIDITILDNSDSKPYVNDGSVTILDNTKGRLIDFDALINKYPDRIPTACNWGSEKHIASVDYLFDKLPCGFVLLDSDTLVKNDLSPLFDPECCFIGMQEKQHYWFQRERLAPYLMWINTLECKANGVRFWHDGRAYKLSHGQAPYYDTGCSFWEDCKAARLKGRYINIYDYIEHLGGASCKEEPEKAKQWLEQHKELWEDTI